MSRSKRRQMWDRRGARLKPVRNESRVLRALPLLSTTTAQAAHPAATRSYSLSSPPRRTQIRQHSFGLDSPPPPARLISPADSRLRQPSRTSTMVAVSDSAVHAISGAAGGCIAMAVCVPSPPRTLRLPLLPPARDEARATTPADLDLALHAAPTRSSTSRRAPKSRPRPSARAPGRPSSRSSSATASPGSTTA